MKIRALLIMILLISACAKYEVGKVSPQRKHLYDYNNSEDYCAEHPDRCVENIPWH